MSFCSLSFLQFSPNFIKLENNPSISKTLFFPLLIFYLLSLTSTSLKSTQQCEFMLLFCCFFILTFPFITNFKIKNLIHSSFFNFIFDELLRNLKIIRGWFCHFIWGQFFNLLPLTHRWRMFHYWSWDLKFLFCYFWVRFWDEIDSQKRSQLRLNFKL